MSSQLVKLLDENEKQQELLAIEFDKNPQCDAILQSDMNKLNYDNLVSLFCILAYILYSLSLREHYSGNCLRCAKI